ncbi:MAG: hypothetical protein RE468_08890 [Acidithiobacillus caldus]|uniref:hypothetical protein n=1 Tax=Acidithiobacillus caldus TaxID=33059 RepID=UPI002815A8CD|nr:hypothetical protein [Acidithiobacillus caldus]WMT46024.1 MAG: hypothetical protein RE468_08890 [Acidithiobacillus caldus]
MNRNFFLVTLDTQPRAVFVLVSLLAAVVAVAHHAPTLPSFGVSWVAWSAVALGLWLWGGDPCSVAGIAERAAEAAARAPRQLPLVVAIDQARTAVEQKNRKICSIINKIKFYPPFALSVAAAAAPRVLPIPRACRA